MSFKFKMQKILDYREQLEEEAKIRLAEAEKRLSLALKQVEEIQTALTLAQKKAQENPLMSAAEFWVNLQQAT